MTSNDSQAPTETLWPRGLTPASAAVIVGLLGSLAYLVGYAFVASFFGSFGVTPEEVGITQTALVVRAAMLTAIVLAVVLEGTLAVLGGVTLTLGWISLGFAIANWSRPRSPARIARGCVAWMRQWLRVRPQWIRTLALSLACALIVLTAVRLVGVSWFGPWRVGTYGLGLVLDVGMAVLMWALPAALKPFAAVASTVFVIAGCIVIGFGDLGSHLAEEVKHGPTEETFATLAMTGLDVYPVRVDWTTDRPPSVPDHPLHLHLGHANGVVVLTDSTQIYRVRDSQVRALVSTRQPPSD